MLSIFKKEMKGYFTGVIGYVFLVIYLAVAGIIFAYSTLFSMSADVTTYYTAMLIFSAVMLPILTMKTFSEERKAKTEQLLLTAPVSITAMVIGKFLAAYVIYGGAVVLTSLYFLLLAPYATLEVAVLLGNAVALLLVGLVFISIGLFVSSLTENQLSAAIGSIAIILGFLGIGILTSLLPTSFGLRFVLDALSIFTRFSTFTSGYFDLASFVYYLSVSGVFLYLTVRVFDRRRYN
jgi:ABC-2 type transport system permease protein